MANGTKETVSPQALRRGVELKVKEACFDYSVKTSGEFSNAIVRVLRNAQDSATGKYPGIQLDLLKLGDNIHETS
jgi:hypothetical protein